MTGTDLASSYLEKCRLRLELLRIAFERGGHSDVVREAQECVQLALKAMLRAIGVDPPRVHEVGPQLLQHRRRFPEGVDVDELARISRALRKDREMAFYGAEDLVPTEAYGPEEGARALEWAEVAVRAAQRVLSGQAG